MKRQVKLAILWIARSLGLLRFARWITRKGFIIIGWHGVSLGDEFSRFPSYFVTPEQLKQRIEYLLRHYKIVSLDELLKQHQQGSIQSRQVALTFDDGLKDFSLAAKPILDEFRLPATVYALSSCVERQRESHTMIIRDLFRQASFPELGATNGRHNHCATQVAPVLRENKVGQALQELAKLPKDEAVRDRFVEELAQDLEVDLEKLRTDDIWTYLDADGFAQLSNEGIDIQAHSHDHLNCVEDLEKVYKDTIRCKKLLESVTGRPVEHYCYPSGFWSKRLWPELERAGIKSAVTCNTGPNYVTTPRYALRRFIDHHHVTQLEFEFAVSGLRWLIHRCFHPFRSQVPYEKTTNPGPYF